MAFQPMPDLISPQDDNYHAHINSNNNNNNNSNNIGNNNHNNNNNNSNNSNNNNNNNNNGNNQEDHWYNEKVEILSKVDEEMSVETKTTSETHFINWKIDHRSLHIAKLAPKGDKRGVIEANIEKGNHRFKLELCASGWRNSQDGYCAFYLTVVDQDDLFVARYRVQVGEVTRMSSVRHDFHLGVGFPNFCMQENLGHRTSEESIRFQVTIEVFNSHSHVKPPPHPSGIATQQKPEMLLTTLMYNMYRQRLHTDITLICQGLKIPTHKCILAHASPVFRSMFSHNMLETTTNEVRMNEWDPDIVLAMVEFLYTCRIPNQNQTRAFETRRAINNSVGGSMISHTGGLDCDEDLSSLDFSMASPSPSPMSFTIEKNSHRSQFSASGIYSEMCDNENGLIGQESDDAENEISDTEEIVDVDEDQENQNNPTKVTERCQEFNMDIAFSEHHNNIDNTTAYTNAMPLSTSESNRFKNDDVEMSMDNTSNNNSQNIDEFAACNNIKKKHNIIQDEMKQGLTSFHDKTKKIKNENIHKLSCKIKKNNELTITNSHQHSHPTNEKGLYPVGVSINKTKIVKDSDIQSKKYK